MDKVVDSSGLPVTQAAYEALVRSVGRLTTDLVEAEQAYQACLPYAKRYDWLRNNRTVIMYEDQDKPSPPLWRDILDSAIDSEIRRAHSADGGT